MHIALVIFNADPARGGAERYTADLASGLRGRGHIVTVIASEFSPGNPPPYSVQFQPGSGSRLHRYLYFLDQLDQHLASHSYDIVHAMLPVRRCDVYHPHAGIAAATIRSGHLKYKGTPWAGFSWIANQFNLKRRRFEMIERELLGSAKPPVVLCLSEYVKRDVCAHYTLPDSCLATLFNATDLKRFDPALRPDAGTEIRKQFGILPDRIVALIIAQDFQRKGLSEAIQALAGVADGRLILLVVGKQDPTAYRRQAERLGIGRQVIFAGKTTDSYAFYRAAEFFVLPTRHDPCSLVVLEALAMGLPVISTVFNGACEIMENGQHGFVLPDPADIFALTNSLRHMLDETTRRRMSAACIDLRPRLSYERHLDELLRIYDGVDSRA